MSYVKGEVTYKLYQNLTNGYSIYKMKIEETDEEAFKNYETCSVTGYFPNIEIGVIYVFKGSAVLTKKYGYTFQADTSERVLPTSREGIIEYLSGDDFKGIGKKTAEAIVDKLGLDCIKIIIENKDSLDGIKGMNELKKEVIHNELSTNKEVEEILITLYSYGITPKLSMRIYDRYKLNTLKVIKDNPYRLIEDVDGIAFLKADKIALSTGINEMSESRIEACIVYTMFNHSIETGNTLIEKENLFLEVKKYLGFNTKDKDDVINNCFENLIFKGKLVSDGNTVSDYRIYNSEKYVARKLTMMKNTKADSIFKEEIYNLLEGLEKKLDIIYEDDQKDAIYRALTNKVSIITGGPGTGKTTIERGIIYCYNQLTGVNKDLIKLAAPTGKAAKRIEESTGYSAMTIHRTLAYDTNGEFGYNKFNPLQAKLVVIDEASMIDIFLFRALLEALPNECILVIVGDSDQLPSIGPGQVLKDLIDSNAFTVTKLSKIHRQKKNSKIISLAYDILDEEIKTEIDKDHEELIAVNTPQDNLENILYSVINHFMGLGYSLFTDIQVLIPIYKGGVGIDRINKYLQQTFNGNYNIEFDYNSTSYFLDDKVIQLVNQYEDSVMNGDMGIVSDIIKEKELMVDYQGNVVKYKGQDTMNINLAYAISIHKSQGSEFPVVIVPIYRNYRSIMNKKLLYTAVTRAKEYLILVGDMSELNKAIRIASVDRKTRIKEFL